MALVTVICSSCWGRKLPDHTCEDCMGKGTLVIHTSQIGKSNGLGIMPSSPAWLEASQNQGEQLELFVGVDLGKENMTVAVSSVDSQGNVTLHELVQGPHSRYRIW